MSVNDLQMYCTALDLLSRYLQLTLRLLASARYEQGTRALLHARPGLISLTNCYPSFWTLGIKLSSPNLPNLFVRFDRSRVLDVVPTTDIYLLYICMLRPSFFHHHLQGISKW